MQTLHYSIYEYGSSHVANIIVETLKRSANKIPIDLSDIAQASRTTSKMTNEVLRDLIGLDDPSVMRLSTSARFELALQAAGIGAFERATRELTWQEFEEFTEECLRTAGFETQKGVVFKDRTRRWQIDVTAVKNKILLALDCKHWKSLNYSSRFEAATEHQELSLTPLIRHLRSKGSLTPHEIWALPVIITLFEPRTMLLNGVAMVSIGQLPDFVEHLTPYNHGLPFILDKGSAETPISQSSQPRKDLV